MRVALHRCSHAGADVAVLEWVSARERDLRRDFLAWARAQQAVHDDAVVGSDAVLDDAQVVAGELPQRHIFRHHRVVGIDGDGASHLCRGARRLRDANAFIHATSIGLRQFDAPSGAPFSSNEPNTVGTPFSFRQSNIPAAGAVDIYYSSGVFDLKDDEALVVDVNGDHTTVCAGIMSVTSTQNRSSP